MCGLKSLNAMETEIKVVRKYLKLKVLEDTVTFNRHKQERENVYDMMKKTISFGESHSALLVGPRGCGKTTLINSVLHQLSREVDLTSDAIIVRLNGLIHSDEKISLKSITAQMQLENAVGDRVFGTFAENLAFLLSCLNSGTDRRCKSMVFVLEEFDMFCKSQTLLYNLFDITHSKAAPMCVLGVTNRLDVMELLEKRVKSRFSHHHIFLFPNDPTGPPRSYPDIFKQTFEELLTIPVSVRKSIEGTPRKRKEKTRKKSVVSIGSEPMDIDTPKNSLHEKVFTKCNVNPKLLDELSPEFIEDWNSHVLSVANTEKVVDAIEKFCYYIVNQQMFRNVLFQIISKLSPSKPYIDADDVVTIIDKIVSPEHRVKLLQSLSILELSLVIAMKHSMDIFDGQPMNFEMILHRYTKFANANSSTQTVPRPVILKAFEHLQALEIIMPVKSSDSIYNVSDTTASRVQKEYQLYTLAVPVYEIQEAVKGFKALPTEISHWFNNSVI